MMKIGLDTFTIRELELDFIGQLDYIKEHGLAGAQLHDIPADLEEMKAIRQHADKLKLFIYDSLSHNMRECICNPRSIVIVPQGNL